MSESHATHAYNPHILYNYVNVLLNKREVYSLRLNYVEEVNLRQKSSWGIYLWEVTADRVQSLCFVPTGFLLLMTPVKLPAHWKEAYAAWMLSVQLLPNSKDQRSSVNVRVNVKIRHQAVRRLRLSQHLVCLKPRPQSRRCFATVTSFPRE